MKASFNGVDIVREGKKLFRKSVIVLNGHLDEHVVFETVYENWRVKGGVATIQIFDKRHNAAFVKELLLGVRAFILNRNRDTFV